MERILAGSCHSATAAASTNRAPRVTGPRFWLAHAKLTAPKETRLMAP